ncbi:MAG: hypothetical protein SP4CHLAM5_10560 [Chlamydiia bacterium]|nr:hypothetical protein [Chlamydiia bacterium]MCH9618913.1 hypothetical protein [Chlamydiia bacterium]MCH9624626.1 hypothetical protein [Chlamydiia bacterium]
MDNIANIFNASNQCIIRDETTSNEIAGVLYAITLVGLNMIDSVCHTLYQRCRGLRERSIVRQ